MVVLSYLTTVWFEFLPAERQNLQVWVRESKIPDGPNISKIPLLVVDY